MDAHPFTTKRLIMTPKDKAKELVDKFTLVGLQQRNEGIQCAVIAVGEILEAIKTQPYGLHYLSEAGYWGEVKKLIENYDTENI